MGESATVHLAVIEYLCRGSRAVSLQTFTTRHSNRKLSIVMALSTTFTQFAPETTKFGKITPNKGHSAVQGHSRLPIFVPIKSSYAASYVKRIARQVLRIKSWIYESARNLYRGRRSVPVQTFTTRLKKQKLASISLYCKSRRSKTANIKMLSANSTHRS